MADKIAIDKTTFFNHLSNFYASWKADKRSGNTLFGGAGSIVILMGKTKSDESSFQKNNAMHVCHPLLIKFLRLESFPVAMILLRDAN
jgi:Xaa-Pro aminopeptidase